MSAPQLLLGLLRLALIVGSAFALAGRVRRTYLPEPTVEALLVQVVIAVSVLLVVAELLGLISQLRTGPLIAAMLLLAGLCAVLLRPGQGRRAFGVLAAGTRELRRAVLGRQPTTIAVVLAVAVLSAHWLVLTANSLSAGIASFDSLWYHMPFAARFAQSASVSSLHFTLADAYTAYYPANAELIHTVGIVALRSDLLSPLVNLMWLPVALIASWSLGRRWSIQPQTLAAGCLALSVPVLGSTQPGQAFNDIPGLAMLIAAAALALGAYDRPIMLISCGLALGFAVGTKLTFMVPAFVLFAAMVMLNRKRGLRRGVVLLLAPLALTGCWWYVRNAVVDGNPLGLRLQVGPLVLPGAKSPLASHQQGTVIANLQHVSDVGSHFVSGLFHALGPAWPVLLALAVVGIIWGISCRDAPEVRALGLTALSAAVAYFFLPTSASDIQHQATLFEVNLRYLMPAIALGLPLMPIMLALRSRRALSLVAPVAFALLLVTQLEHSLWFSQALRHLAFGLALLALAAVLVLGLPPLAGRRRAMIGAAAVLLCGGFGLAYVVQRHYFQRRYLIGGHGDPGQIAIYRWAQRISHARIALYGIAAQYPVYGARVTNRVDYLGRRSADGSFLPIEDCRTWRTAINRGRYEFVVLTPAPTRAIPVSWTASDPAATLLMRPADGEYVFKLKGPLHVGRCGATT
jgi:hypothetical protein